MSVASHFVKSLISLLTKKMEEEGRRLFLQALGYRFRRQYGKAAAAFDAAAALGNGDACIHLYYQFEEAGCCRPNRRSPFDLGERLRRGAKAGNVMCALWICLRRSFGTIMDALDNLHAEFGFQPTLQAEITLYDAFDISRVFHANEVEAMKNAAKEALRIHDPLPVVSYITYLIKFSGNPNASVQSIPPRMLGHFIYLTDFDGGYPIEFKDRRGRFQDFDVCSVLIENEFGLSESAIRVARCVIGQLMARNPNPEYVTREIGIDNEKEDDDDDECVVEYRTWRDASHKAAVAWLGCFRRGVLESLNRDMVRLIAQMVFDPVEWAEN